MAKAEACSADRWKDKARFAQVKALEEKERVGFCEEMLALAPQLQAADEEPLFLPTSGICDILG